jgi:hypothetical protein
MISQCQIENDAITGLSRHDRSNQNQARLLEAMRLIGRRQPWLSRHRLKFANGQVRHACLVTSRISMVQSEIDWSRLSRGGPFDHRIAANNRSDEDVDWKASRPHD